MALFKQVNGEAVELTAQEESDTRAQWAANDNAQVAESEAKLIEDLIEDARKVAVEALIATDKANIEGMNPAQRLARATARGLR